MARIPLGCRPRPHGAGAHERRPHRRVRLVPHGALRRPLRPRLARPRHRLAAKHHIAVVIGTPTAAPPAWLTQKYPETLRINDDGRTRPARQPPAVQLREPQVSRALPRHRHQIAERFGHNPNVIGWQIDNEYADEVFDPATPRRSSSNCCRPSTRRSTTSTPAGPPPTGRKPTPTGPRSRSRTTHGNPGLLLELEALRHRHLAQLPAATRSTCSARTPTAPVHHHQHRRAGPTARTTTRSRRTSTSPAGTTTSAPAISTRNNGACSRLRPRLEAQELLGHGDPARLRELVPSTMRSTRARPAPWPGTTIGHGADAVLYWQWRSALNGQGYRAAPARGRAPEASIVLKLGTAGLAPLVDSARFYT